MKRLRAFFAKDWRFYALVVLLVAVNEWIGHCVGFLP